MRQVKHKAAESEEDVLNRLGSLPSHIVQTFVPQPKPVRVPSLLYFSMISGKLMD
jgi:hypothetical protein